MGTRALVGATLLLTGTLCIAAALMAAAWVDTTYTHESVAVYHEAVQASLQGKPETTWNPGAGILSAMVIWVVFICGGTLSATGLMVSLRSLPVRA